MKTESELEPEVDAPIPDRASRPSRIRPWIRQHKWISLGSGAVVVAVVVVVTVVVSTSGGSSTQKKAAPAKVTTSPIIASYRQQLPALAATVAKNPTSAPALRAYGVALYASGDIAGAQTQYEAELKIDPSDAVLLNNLGNVRRDLGKYDKAVQAYQQAISIAPQSPNSYVNLANLYNYTLNQKQLGITTLQAAQKNLPNNPDLGVLLGIAFEQVHDATNARAAYKAVLLKDPTNAAATAGLKRVGA